jgi:sugar lactone lactonase YvrE
MPVDAGPSPSVARPGLDYLGEAPVWEPRTASLVWVDITAGVVHRWNPQTDEHGELAVDGEVSAAVPRAGGGLVLAVDHSLILHDEDGTQRTLATVELDAPDNRFNDCRCDPAGRLWAGTMSKQRQPGVAALYRLTTDGELRQMISGTTISNGLAWNLHGDRMYFIDSTTQRIDLFDFDAASGTLSDRRPLVAISPADGLPDGMTVDAEDGIWVALFGGGCIRRYTGSGVLDAIVEFPVSNPTCPTFGGVDLDTLYVTTARHRLTPDQRRREPLAGALFAFQPGVRGRPAFIFRA